MPEASSCFLCRICVVIVLAVRGYEAISPVVNALGVIGFSFAACAHGGCIPMCKAFRSLLNNACNVRVLQFDDTASCRTVPVFSGGFSQARLHVHALQ